jgi:hypothetical protein
MEKIMRQTITILATALLASSLLTAAAEARGGGNRGGARIGNEHVQFDGTSQNAMRRFERAYPTFNRDYDASCDDDWEPKALWASSCS